MSSRTKKIIVIVIAVAAMTSPYVAWLLRWNIYDYSRLRNYSPPAEVAQLATDTTMNNKTRNLFYVNHPALNDKTDFGQNCNTTEKTIVLGCFVPGNGVFLYNVTDERLTGVLQVTAAHETLHAAYQRLSQSEKTNVDKMTTDAYANLDNQRIKDTIEEYKKSGADTTNELHSILGTEVGSLPADLEQYYKRYFTDRAKIVAYSASYEKAFDDRKTAVMNYDKVLEELKNQIETSESQVNNEGEAIKAERARLDMLLASKDYENYNNAVPGFNASISAYNAKVKKIRTNIDTYNKTVAERNAIATEESDLVKAIDSRPSTISQ